MLHRIGSPLGSIGMVLLCVCIAQANPSSGKPDSPLEVIGIIDGAKSEGARLYHLLGEMSKRVLVAEQRTLKPHTIPGGYLARMQGQAWQAARDANRLAQMGEPAGEDLRISFELIQLETNRLCRIHAGTDTGRPEVESASEKLNQLRSTLQRFLSQAEQSIDTGKLDRFEQLMELKGIALQESLAYVDHEKHDLVWGPFSRTLERGDQAIAEQRYKEYAAIAEQTIHENSRLAVNYAGEAKRITNELIATGIASLGEGVEGDAAESFAYLADLWGQASISLNRSVALKWALKNNPNVIVEPTPRELYFDAESALINLLSAVASAPETNDIAVLYPKILKHVATTNRRTSKYANFIDKFDAPLERMTRQDQSLRASISSYRMATMQPMRWRKKFVAQQVGELSKDYETTRKLFYAKQKPKPVEGTPFLSIAHRPTVAASNSLVAPASVLIRETSRALVDAKVLGGKLIRLAPDSRTSIAPVEIQGYMSAAVPKPMPAQLDTLRRSLLITETHGPLSLDAADAISSAELADYAGFGGIIDDVHLESLVTRYATTPSIAYVLIPLGEAADLTTLAFPREQLCWRLTVDPAWAHSDTMVVRPHWPED